MKKFVNTDDTVAYFFLRVQKKSESRPGLRGHLALLILTLLIFIGAVAQSFWLTSDPARYQCYALTFWQGSSAVQLLPKVQCAFLQITHHQAALHMLPKEYPPLTLLPFSLPLLLPFINYQIVFSFLMALTILLTYWLLLRFGPYGSAPAFTLFIALGACALAPMRYDLLPALATLLSLMAASRQRWTLAYLALAISILLKIYPILLLPALFIAEQQAKGRLSTPTTPKLTRQPVELWQALRGIFHWQWWNALCFFALLVGVTGLFALSDFNNAVVSQFAYFLQRPIQIESLSATLIWLAHLGGLTWSIRYDFGSINLYTALNNGISPLFTLLLILGVLYTLWLQWQRKCTLVQTAMALLLVFIATGKVFSPQYLIWLIPLLAYAGAYTRLWTAIWGAISLLTTIIYIVFYSQILDPNHITIPAGFFEAAALRNILFAFLTLAYLCNWYGARKTVEEVTSSSQQAPPIIEEVTVPPHV
jgi:hypothetical protein